MLNIEKKHMPELGIFKGARILVTGHTGFKGSWLSLWLTQLGAEVFGVSSDIPTNPSHATTIGLSDRLSDIRLDIRDGDQLKLLVAKIQPDFVFHLAAQALVRRSYDDPLRTFQTNAMGTANLLEALRVLERPCNVVLVTSDKSYDNVEWVWGYRETDQLGGLDPYSASKGASELLIRSFIHSYYPRDGLVRICVGRAGNVIGGGDWAEDRIVPDCIRAWSLNKSVAMRNPSATRPWQHVLEPLSGYINLAVELKKSSTLHGEAFNFGPSGEQIFSVGDLVSEMGNYWDKVRWQDVSSQYNGPHESGLLKLNCDKALHYLKWQAVWSFDDTVRETILWYKNYYENFSKKNIAELSIKQINFFTQSAKLKGLSWAQ